MLENQTAWQPDAAAKSIQAPGEGKGSAKGLAAERAERNRKPQVTAVTLPLTPGLGKLLHDRALACAPWLVFST